MSTKTQTILHADCREGIKKIKTNSVSLILTDPPYFIDGMSSEWDRKKLDIKKSKAKVVGSLPVGMKFSPHQSKQLRSFLTPIAKDWLRVIKPAGFVLCFSQPRLSHSVACALEDAGFHIKDLYVWKRHGQAKAFTHSHFVEKNPNLTRKEKDKILKSIGGRKTPQLKPDAEMIIMAQAPSKEKLIDNWMKYKTGFIDVQNRLIDPDRFPSSVMVCKKPTDRYGHITAKPVELLRHLIRIFCEKNGLVLDPFAGCGSCAEACFTENYEHISFEIDSKYFKTALKRLEQLKSSLKTPNPTAKIKT